MHETISRIWTLEEKEYIFKVAGQVFLEKQPGLFLRSYKRLSHHLILSRSYGHSNTPPLLWVLALVRASCGGPYFTLGSSLLVRV